MTAEHELSITRFIHATPERVWSVWTTRLAEWWAPEPWTTELVALELVAGGRFAMVMRGPGGDTVPIESVILEAVPATRIVSTDAFAAGWMPRPAFMVALFTFAEEDGGTRYTAIARHWTAEAKDQHAAMGFQTGWTAVAAQLAALAEG